MNIHIQSVQPVFRLDIIHIMYLYIYCYTHYLHILFNKKNFLLQKFFEYFIIISQRQWERSSVWLERLPVTQEVASSSLVVPELKKSYKSRTFLIGMIMVRTRQIRELREGAEAGAFLRLC